MKYFNYKFTFKLVVTSGILLIILKYLNSESLIHYLVTVNGVFFSFAIITFIISIFINTKRLQLLNSIKSNLVSFQRILKINFIGLFFSIFLPGRTFGDVVRGYYMADSKVEIESTISTLLIWRIIGIFNMFFIAIIASIFSYPLLKNESILFSILGFTFVVIIILFILLNTKLVILEDKNSTPVNGNKNFINIKYFVNKVVRILLSYKNEKRLLLFNFSISFIVNLFIIITWFFIASSVNANISIIIFLLFIPIISILQIIPITFNGVGVREASAIFLFGSIGIKPEVMLIISLLYSGLSILVSSLGGLVYLFYKKEFD